MPPERLLRWSPANHGAVPPRSRGYEGKRPVLRHHRRHPEFLRSPVGGLGIGATRMTAILECSPTPRLSPSVAHGLGPRASPALHRNRPHRPRQLRQIRLYGRGAVSISIRVGLHQPHPPQARSMTTSRPWRIVLKGILIGALAFRPLVVPCRGSPHRRRLN